ncbi:MAG: beta-alanine degradation protein BauB [Acidobacteriaceae bacterium]|jgi:quercetin dioxygenase-like cupin family protein|nr:beta-alanine degradation protein BauB [Acidobacteriaceae bacterium]
MGDSDFRHFLFVRDYRAIIDRSRQMKTLATLALSLTLLAAVFAQDAMQYGVKHLKALAEDDRVRVLHFTPSKGDKTPMHSHPETVVYVIKGGKTRITLPNGTSTVSDLKSGQAFLRPPVTHSDEALDDLDAIIIELKK